MREGKERAGQHRSPLIFSDLKCWSTVTCSDTLTNHLVVVNSRPIG